MEEHSSFLRSCNLFQKAKSGNTKFNRYSNILPYDNNIVDLSSKRYINASLIPSPEYGNFIATQAPLPHTIEDFYEMLWDHDVSAILMLARWTPNNNKSDRYWPDHVNGEISFKGIGLVAYLVEVKITSDLEIRELEIVKSFDNGNRKESRRVKHYHYLDWPDHGLPNSLKSFLNLRNLIASSCTPESNIIVHCSAGIGRTGTYITVDRAIRILEKNCSSKEKISEDLEDLIPKLVRDLRMKRMFMVEVMDQFLFCYDAVHKYFESL